MKKEIDQMLVKAGAYFGGEGVVYADFDPKKFATLIRADEREACAKVCDDLHPGLATKRAAEIIRARGSNT